MAVITVLPEACYCTNSLNKKVCFNKENHLLLKQD